MIETAAILAISAICIAIWDANNGLVFNWPRFAIVAGVLLGVTWLITPAAARDSGQWEGSNPAIREWYRSLMQPDNPNVSCCGEADAYWCDEIKVRQGKTFCSITDDRDDKPLGRPHVAIGTEFEIPNHKLKWDKSNPTGHAIIFVASGVHVLCFVQGTGI
ncbi:MAG: uncharacterized protein JWR80_9994 [Bradyrhizobium sp.]|nr:uncharacterized protein [Bradyrhizobium sp.]